MFCKFCNKECKNNNSIINHERLCKLNSNRHISSFIEYNKKVKNLEVIKLNTNGATKAKNLGKVFIISNKTREKIRIKSLGRKHSEKFKTNQRFNAFKNKLGGHTSKKVFIIKKNMEI